MATAFVSHVTIRLIPRGWRPRHTRNIAMPVRQCAKTIPQRDIPSSQFVSVSPSRPLSCACDFSHQTSTLNVSAAHLLKSLGHSKLAASPLRRRKVPGGAAGLQNQSGGRKVPGGFDSLPSPPIKTFGKFDAANYSCCNQWRYARSSVINEKVSFA